MLKFTPITLNDAQHYISLYSECDEKAADYTFSNLWCWQDKYHFEIAFDDNLCWLRHYNNNTPIYNPPIGNWHRNDWNKLLKQHFPQGFSFVRVPETLANIWKKYFDDTLSIVEERDHFEYVYSIPELIFLNGYRFRNKRKLSNQFKQYYNYIYKSVSPELIADIKEFQQHWINSPEIKKDKDINMIMTENKAIMRMLDNWKQLPKQLFGGVLIIDNKVIAFALGEKIDNETIAIHFEKASLHYRGSYAAINRILLENSGGNYRFVNREQDLGLEGLRKVKLEYNPVRFIKKYHITNTYRKE